MQESLITKKVIAYSLKKVMETTPFQKVSISQIMEQAEIRRQTFYNHFQDKYELLDWIYKQEISENISDFLDYEEWDKVIYRILAYFEKNQVFYRNALAISEQNSFDQSFYSHTQGLLATIIRDIAKKKNVTKDIALLAYSAEFYSHAFVGITKTWILDGCKTPTQELADETVAVLVASIYGLLES
ncbi:dihydroxyacetone kinase transcriptional activator DhaS [Vagococcus coleopterorum]|uniref:Dihydroxyacetone kinase transcriptional activator DhaS n=1 Tax=Vagococcus coleopterorum TaxID=2714946 RepID=A0A6G8AMF1_9ENTE|nr:dihydroxyacetone kinase transcriptional activator DhaS [Vagococcus coleopterorum]QIL46177.1 dihydroxyacetone kinase transcriptional activator DhaS [Vagococcus coleopterorum]